MAKRKRQKVDMPMSGAGLIRYMDEEGKGLKFKPEQIIYAATALVLVEILVKMGFI